MRIIKTKVKLLLLPSILLIALTINNLSFSTYTQKFETHQTITAKPWEVDTSVEYKNQTIDGQVLKGFKPGDTKENLIKLKNDNDYKTQFNLEINTKGELFENTNIGLTLNQLDKSDTTKNTTYDFYDVHKDNEGTTYYIKLQLEPNEEKLLRLDITWDINDENHKLYQGKAGQIVYTSKAEQVVK